MFLEFLRFARNERNQQRWDERHTSKTALIGEPLYQNTLLFQKSIEDTIIEMLSSEKLRLMIQSLPQIQCRRLILYYEYGLTYMQIAEIEGCSFVAVKLSIDNAKNTIRKNF